MKEELRQKFRDLEISPPPSVWNGIAMQLREQREDRLTREKVLDIQIEPPPRTFNKIIEIVNARKTQTSLFSIFRQNKLPRAAAVLAGIVVLGSILVLNNRVRRNQFATTESSSSGQQRQILPAESLPNVSLKPMVAQISGAGPRANAIYSALRAKKKTFPDKKRKLDQAVVRETAFFPGPTIPARPIRNENGEIIQDIRLMNKPNNKYVSVTGPNGVQTKISAKFAQFLLYLNGDNDTDSKEGVFHKSFLESLTWKARFQTWRDALSQNAFVPTSTNFMDILELKDLILQHKDID